MASATQRFTRTSPCPICGGYKELPAGHGQRCYGFLSSDGLYAHCTREEHAGSVPADPSGTSYPHRMIGDCRCGVRHDPNPPSPTNGHGRRIVATYDYVDAHGILQYQTVRYDPKGFAQRHPDSQNGWVWNMHGVRPLIYHLPEILQAIAAGQVICTAEGEEDVEAIRRCGYAATCNHGGANKWEDIHSQFLQGAVDVVLFGDHDDTGREHLARQQVSLQRFGIRPRVAQLDGLPEHGDVRDWLMTHTAEDLTRVIEAAATPSPSPRAATAAPTVPPAGSALSTPVWICTQQGRLQSCQHNSILWLEAQGAAETIVLDTFKQEIILDGQVLTDDQIIDLVRQIEADKGIPWMQSHMYSAVVSIGTRQASSSLVRWLESLQWDKTRRIWRFFTDMYGADVSRYTEACSTVLFRSAIARAYQPGCKADVMVVLIGAQGLGKSKGIEDLVPEQSWYTDDLGGDLNDRKAGEGLQGKWIIEFGEFARINRTTLDVVKAFLSRRVDHYRPAYGRMPKDFPRQCIFVGSTNNNVPLQDLENRRFMPVWCRQAVGDIASIRDQLWAEAVADYKAGKAWWVTDVDMIQTIKDHQDEARQHDEWENLLSLALIAVTKVTMAEAAAHVGLKTSELSKSEQTRLGLVLQTMGFIRKRETTGARLRYYERTI